MTTSSPHALESTKPLPLLEQLQAIDVIEAQATPAPWMISAPGCVEKHYPQGGKKGVLLSGKANAYGVEVVDAELACALRNVYPEMRDRITLLVEEIKAWRARERSDIGHRKYGVETPDDRLNRAIACTDAAGGLT